MLLPLFLSFTGLSLIFMEFFFPSGFLIFSSAIFLGMSVILIILSNASIYFILFYIICLLGLVTLTIALALSRIRNHLVLNEDQKGFYIHQLDPHLLGKSGTVLTDLKPSGYVQIDQNQYQAVVEIGYASKNSLVQVIELRGPIVIVKLLNHEAL